MKKWPASSAAPRNNRPKTAPGKNAGAEARSGAAGQAGGRRSTYQEVEAEIHGEFTADGTPPVFRPVTIVDASDKKQLALRIDVPVEDMARMTDVGS